MLYYFDETADQGYVDKTSTLDEYGILAGIAIPELRKDSFEEKFDEVLFFLKQQNYEKLHCTEIFKDNNNEEAQQEMYNIFLELKECVIIHEGAYSVGVKQNDEFLSECVEKFIPEKPDHIKVIKSKSRTRLYTTLLTGIIAKLEEFANIEGESEVHMISDRVDPQIQKKSNELLSSLQSPISPVTAKSFNTKTRQKTEVTYNIEIRGKLAKFEKVKSISFEERVTPLSFAADFVCFEMLRHFRRKMKIHKPIKFHSEEIMDGFRLKHKVAFLGENYFSDSVYSPE